MAATGLIVDPATIDCNNIVSDIHVIRKYNAQRFEMEQLTAIVVEDHPNRLCIGYKDTSRDDFWVRGHMPGMPLMPGVIMCEAAAQLCSYYTQKYNLLGAAMVGFGGLEDVRFRDPVLPGDRLVVVCKMIKCRPGRMVVADFQGFVRTTLVVEGVIKGIPLPVEALAGLKLRGEQASE